MHDAAAIVPPHQNHACNIIKSQCLKTARDAHPVAVAAPIDDEEHANVVHGYVCDRDVGAARQHYAMRVDSPQLRACKVTDFSQCSTEKNASICPSAAAMQY